MKTTVTLKAKSTYFMEYLQMETAISCQTLLLIQPIYKMRGNAVGLATRLRAAPSCIRIPIGARVFSLLSCVQGIK